MSYIRRMDFAIFAEAPKGEIGNQKKYDFFECDELIAPIVSVLNRKGYKTESCSSGHIGLSVEGECMVSEDNQMNDEELKQFFTDTMCYSGTIDIHMAKKNRRKVILVSAPDPYAKISFAAGVPGQVPEGWFKDGKSIMYRFDNSEGFDFFHERLDVLERLYAWAQELPEK